jgi:hypothetical protein
MDRRSIAGVGRIYGRPPDDSDEARDQFEDWFVAEVMALVEPVSPSDNEDSNQPIDVRSGEKDR